MGYNRRRFAGAAAAVLLGLVALVASLGLLATPARAQTYAIVQAGHSTTTTTVAPTTTTLKKATGGLAFTGADITVTMGVAAVALGAGGVLVMASRRRKAADR
jgi:hypothetical protein